MKVIHIESGLGNQMLSYCEYLAMKKANPTDTIYIENIVYNIEEANEHICQWNGYELDRVFHVNAQNISELFTEDQWNEILADIHKTRFWERNWNYPVLFTDAFRKQGIDLVNIRGDFEEPSWPRMVKSSHESASRRIKDKLERYFLPYVYLQQYVRKKRASKCSTNYAKDLFVKTDKDIFAGQRLTFKFKKSGIEILDNEIRSTFQFPAITDKENQKALTYIQTHESVAIHARRGDMLGVNHATYVTGYFKRAVNFVREHTQYPIFFIFCDPTSVEWAKKHSTILGLNFKKDEVHFVDWNKSTDSFRDMQLMAACKHQIITNSSFGWWASWLNTNPKKITCSPDSRINTTHSF